MTAEKGRLFSIGQFAALHGVNKKTLMWYDEIGLFCPAVVKENGYRYYTYFQSATLEAILLLRELDVPVARIRSFLDDRSAQSLAALWDEQLDAVDRKLARLRELRRTMQTQGQLLHAYQLSFVHPRTGQPMTFEAPLPEYFEKVLRKLKS